MIIVTGGGNGAILYGIYDFESYGCTNELRARARARASHAFGPLFAARSMGDPDSSCMSGWLAVCTAQKKGFETPLVFVGKSLILWMRLPVIDG